METTTLREKLHSLMDNSSNDKPEEVYHLLKDEEYSDAFKAELDEEYLSYQNDGEVISKEEIDKMFSNYCMRKNNMLSYNISFRKRATKEYLESIA